MILMSCVSSTLLSWIVFIDILFIVISCSEVLLMWLCLTSTIDMCVTIFFCMLMIV